MKTEEHRRLWGSIQQFLPNDPNAAVPFPNKIAAKQNGSPPFMEESPPPADIGPPPTETTSSPPKLTWNIRKEVLTVVITLLIIPLVFIACFYKTVSPFSLNASQFFVFFPLLVVSCILSFILLQLERGRSLKEVVKSRFYTDANIFQTVQFLYGKERVIRTAIVDLIRRSLLVVTTDRLFKVYNDRYHQPAKEESPLIAGFINEQRSCVTYERIFYTWYKEPGCNPSLTYLKSLAQYNEGFFTKYHVLLIPFVTGIVRFIQGMLKNIDVSDLVWQMALLSIAFVQIMKFISLKAIVKAKVEEKAKIKQKVGLLYPDKIVGAFALNGREAISWFSDGIILTEIFDEPLPINEANNSWKKFLDDDGEFDLISFIVRS